MMMFIVVTNIVATCQSTASTPTDWNTDRSGQSYLILLLRYVFCYVMLYVLLYYLLSVICYLLSIVLYLLSLICLSVISYLLLFQY